FDKLGAYQSAKGGLVCMARVSPTTAGRGLGANWLGSIQKRGALSLVSLLLRAARSCMLTQLKAPRFGFVVAIARRGQRPAAVSRRPYYSRCCAAARSHPEICRRSC